VENDKAVIHAKLFAVGNAEKLRFTVFHVAAQAELITNAEFLDNYTAATADPKALPEIGFRLLPVPDFADIIGTACVHQFDNQRISEGIDLFPLEFPELNIAGTGNIVL